MQSKKEQRRIGREKLQRIIEMCMSVESRTMEPFMLNVDDIIRVIKEYFPQWEQPEDLCLDAETIHHLASVIRMQSEWIKSRSTSLYTDPFLLEEKLVHMEGEEITDAFLKAWHPIIELEQISIHSLAESIRYWETLTPLKERWKQIPAPYTETTHATREELIKQKILMDRAFSEELERFWQELRNRRSERGEGQRILYWDFVGAETYEETVQRAFMTSFLVTYGYATLEIHPLEERIFIKAYEKPPAKTGGKQQISIPIAITHDEWQRWKRGGEE